MADKQYTVAIIGVGARGAGAYGRIIHNNMQGQLKIVALCDKNQDRLDRWSAFFGVDKSNCFLDEDEFFKEKRADALIVGTQDRDHVGHAVKGFKTGYDMLIEKPLTEYREECEQLLQAQKESGRKAIVCHVLRYAPAYVKAQNWIKNGDIGKLVAINALERVGHWHQAHSYVRGNWRTTKTATPMILAKCCHDLDLLQNFAGSACKTISSVGDLSHFKPECAPEGASTRCTECKHIDTCPYSAKYIYIDRWYTAWPDDPAPKDRWPWNVIATPPLTEEKLWEAIKTGPYGQCVYHCDNDVVDHQITTMEFENGVKATLTMTGFAAHGRRYHFFGTHGEIILDEANNELILYRNHKEKESYEIDKLISQDDQGYGHGGGDVWLVRGLYDLLDGKGGEDTALHRSVESHLMGICAEQSRMQDGKVIYVHEKA